MTIDSVEDLSPIVQYTASHNQVDFDYPFPIFEDEDLVVSVGSGAKSLGADYTVSDAGNDTGGTVTFTTAFLGGEIVTIERDIPIERSSDFQQNGPWSSAALNTEFNRLTLISQQIDSAVQRALRIPATADVASSDLELDPVVWANKYLTFDALGKPSPAALSSTTMTRATIGDLFLPRTAAEILAGVVPVNTFFVPGNVDRYGTNTTPGTTDMTPAFNAAFKQAKVTGGVEVTYGASAPYLTLDVIDATFLGSANQQGVSLRNIGPVSQDARMGIIAGHNAEAVINFTGTDKVIMHGVSIRTDTLAHPKTGVLWARNAAGGSQFNRMYNCSIIGKFDVACFYNFGSEDSLLIGNYFVNTSTSAGTACAIWTSSNINGIASSGTCAPILSTPISTIDHVLIGNEFLNQAGTNTSDCVRLEGIDGWKFFGGWALSASASVSGRALVYVDMSVGASNSCIVEGLQGEVTGTLHAYGVLFSNDSQTPSGWRITNSRLSNATFAIATAGSNPTLTNFYISNITEQPAVSHGVRVNGTLQSSVVHDTALLLNIGTDKNNDLTGDVSRWTITTFNKSNWTDTGATNKTWTPVTSALTGTITVSNAICLVHGNMVTVTMTMSAAGGLSCSAGVNIGGLPFAALGRAAGKVVNADTPIDIGSCVAVGSNIKLPVISNTTATVVISVTYARA